MKSQWEALFWYGVVVASAAGFVGGGLLFSDSRLPRWQRRFGSLCLVLSFVLVVGVLPFVAWRATA